MFLRITLAFNVLGLFRAFGIWLAKGDPAVISLSVLGTVLLFIVLIVATVAREIS